MLWEGESAEWWFLWLLVTPNQKLIMPISSLMLLCTSFSSCPLQYLFLFYFSSFTSSLFLQFLSLRSWTLTQFARPHLFSFPPVFVVLPLFHFLSVANLFTLLSVVVANTCIVYALSLSLWDGIPVLTVNVWKPATCTTCRLWYFEGAPPTCCSIPVKTAFCSLIKVSYGQRQLY